MKLKSFLAIDHMRHPIIRQRKRYTVASCSLSPSLNRITKDNNALLPHSDDAFDMLGDTKVFSKMDLKTVFHEIRV